MVRDKTACDKHGAKKEIALGERAISTPPPLAKLALNLA
jgi:hypothetical protein